MKNNPAFPTIHEDSYKNSDGENIFGIQTTDGMTMLEYYAGCALASVDDDCAQKMDFRSPEDCAVWCFDMAETMCKEAEKRRKNA